MVKIIRVENPYKQPICEYLEMENIQNHIEASIALKKLEASCTDEERNFGKYRIVSDDTILRHPVTGD
jgi:hypothetical protein